MNTTALSSLSTYKKQLIFDLSIHKVKSICDKHITITYFNKLNIEVIDRVNCKVIILIKITNYYHSAFNITKKI